MAPPVAGLRITDDLQMRRKPATSLVTQIIKVVQRQQFVAVLVDDAG